MTARGKYKGPSYSEAYPLISWDRTYWDNQRPRSQNLKVIVKPIPNTWDHCFSGHVNILVTGETCLDILWNYPFWQASATSTPYKSLPLSIKLRLFWQIPAWCLCVFSLTAAKELFILPTSIRNSAAGEAFEPPEFLTDLLTELALGLSKRVADNKEQT